MASWVVIWLKPGEDEAVELDLADGQVAAQRQADGGADDAGLRERRVHDAVRAELGDQAVGDAVNAAERSDVLAHQQGLGVVAEGGAQALVDGLGNGHGGHQWPAPSAAVLVGKSRAVLLEPGQLLGHQRVRLHVGVGEGGPDVRGLRIVGGLADIGGQFVAVGRDLLEEGVVGHALGAEVLLQPLQRILGPPQRLFGGFPVLRGVVRRGVRADAVGEGLDQHRAVALPGVLERPLRDGVHGDDVVAVHPDAREPVALGPVGQRDAGLHRLGTEMAQWLFWQKNTTGAL